MGVGAGNVPQGKTLSIEGFWSGAPGNFSIDLQTSDTDADGMYQIEGTELTQAAATVNTTANTFRAEFTNITAAFARAFLKTRANAVNLTLKIRLQ